MLIKNIETENEFEIELEFFKEYLHLYVKDFEFVSGTKKEEKAFKDAEKTINVKNASDEDLEHLLIEPEERVNRHLAKV